MHSHDWERDVTRKHNRRGRYFVVCSCGAKSQCSDNDLVFNTGTQKMDDNQIKRVRSVRLSDSEMDSIESGKLRLVIIKRRITVVV